MNEFLFFIINPLHNPVPRSISEYFAFNVFSDDSSLIFRVVVGAIALSAEGIGAFLGFVILGVEMKLFQPMAHVALSCIRTAAIHVVSDVVLHFPVDAGDGLIVVHRRSSSPVRQSVGINAQLFVVRNLLKRTKLSFVVKHIEILILHIIVNQQYLYFFLTVSK